MSERLTLKKLEEVLKKNPTELDFIKPIPRRFMNGKMRKDVRRKGWTRCFGHKVTSYQCVHKQLKESGLSRGKDGTADV